MKKICVMCAALTVFSLGLAGCPDGEKDTSTDSDSDVIGTWRSSSTTNMTLEIGKETFTWVYGTNSIAGSWIRQGTILILDNPYNGIRFGTATLSDGNLELIITYYRTSPSANGTYNLTRSGTPAPSKTTTLKIKNESFTELTDVTWNGVSFGSISTGGASVIKNVGAGTGYVYFKPKNSISARTQEIITVEKDGNKEITIIDSTVIVDTNNTANIGTLGILGVPATLKIKNESFTELTDVIWQSVSFANNQYENSIKTGTNVTQTVSEGAGYIFFRRKSNPISARTNDMVIVKKDNNVEFTFTDNTVIVEVNNTVNTGILGSLNSTVVFFDDAEGEMQQYFEKRSFAGYYKTQSDIASSTSIYNYYYFNTPKNGDRSIAVGGTNTAKLHLKIDLTKPAKLSFWVANKYYAAAGTTFSINDEVKETWKTDMDWSFKSYTLTAGQNDIVWEKNDGYHESYHYSYSYSYYSSHYYYLSLDDILIYYTE